jgi:hypothetical protein
VAAAQRGPRAGFRARLHLLLEQHQARLIPTVPPRSPPPPLCVRARERLAVGSELEPLLTITTTTTVRCAGTRPGWRGCATTWAALRVPRSPCACPSCLGDQRAGAVVPADPGAGTTVAPHPGADQRHQHPPGYPLGPSAARPSPSPTHHSRVCGGACATTQATSVK